ncbi:transcription regulator HTH, apses-type DNA-binding domain-containing protein, partial [Leucosporidium creatinivorum]
VTAMMWDDEGVLCYTVLVGDNLIAERADNGWVNSTKMLNIIGLSRGKRDGLLKHEEQRLVIRRGSKQLKGVWLPLPRARHLAESQGITNDIYPILEDNIEPFL